jgi:N-terminal acetyltransferase B complex catalytic subunit
MYESMGYSTYRTVVRYYSDDPTGASKNGEDALDMRKSLARDKERKHVRENGASFKVDPDDVF